MQHRCSQQTLGGRARRLLNLSIGRYAEKSNA